MDNTYNKNISDVERYQSELKDYLSDNRSDRNGGSFLAADGIDIGRTKLQDDIHNNLKLENPSYHNTYYLGKGKYGTRTLRMNNKEWHKLNKQ